MTHLFVPYKQALELKELGFDETCFGYYNMINHSGKFEFDTRIWENSDDYIEAPLYQQAFDWFREKHGLHSYIDQWLLTTGELVYDYVIISDDIDEEDDGRTWKTVKEAQLACLVDLISIVKTKKL